MDSSGKTPKRTGETDPFRLNEAISLLHRFEKPGAPSEGMFSALGMLTTDAILDQDDRTLTEILDGCKRLSAIKLVTEPEWPPETAGRLLGFIDIIGWATRRVLPLTVRQGVERGTHAHRFLRTILQDPACTSGVLAEKLGVHPTEVSRVGARLESNDLVRRVRVGRATRWSITARGVVAINLAEQLDIEPQQPFDAGFQGELSSEDSRAPQAGREGQLSPHPWTEAAEDRGVHQRSRRRQDT